MGREFAVLGRVFVTSGHGFAALECPFVDFGQAFAAFGRGIVIFGCEFAALGCTFVTFRLVFVLSGIGITGLIDLIEEIQTELELLLFLPKELESETSLL